MNMLLRLKCALALSRYQLLLIAAAAVAATTAVPVWAGDVSASGARATASDSVSESMGSYSENIPVQVPAYHGLEPKLALSYNSSAGNGFLGVGWSLQGLSFIDRAAPGGGTPKYDSSDIYMMDGSELIAGCTTFGGTHCLRHQTYERIVYSASANSGFGGWTVWAKDGTRSTYAPVVSDPIPGTPTFRWGLKTRQDTHGNIVNYNYWCDGSQNCYIDNIAYNGNVIQFNRATRTDGFSFGRGGILGTYSQSFGWLGWTNYRLDSIDVRVGANRARAYQLQYTYSGATNRSRLMSVQEFGEKIGGTLAIDGASLPPTVLDYTSGFAIGSTVPGWSTASWPGALVENAPVGSGCLEGDFNGDGKTDRACEGNYSGAWFVSLSNGSGFAAGTWWNNGPIGAIPLSQTCITGDFNGDGKSDIACEGSAGYWYLGISTGTSWALAYWPSGPVVAAPIGQSCFSGDFNADGKTDITCSTTNGGSTWMTWLVNAAGNGWTATSWTGGPAVAFPITNQCFTGDFNGDGKTDLNCESGSMTGSWRVALSTGAGWTQDWFVNGPKVALPISQSCLPGDYNSDGKTDLACAVGQQDPSGRWVVALSTGASWNNETWSGGLKVQFPISNQCFAADFNGDGKADLTCQPSSGSTTWLTTYSDGDAWRSIIVLPNGPSATWPVSNVCYTGDYQGSGKTGIMCETGPSGSNWNLTVMSGNAPDLLNTVQNSLGGHVLVSYVPSSNWYNAAVASNMPVGSISQTVSVVTTDDGLGTSASTSYGYSGAQWSSAERTSMGYQAAATYDPTFQTWTYTAFSQTPASAGSPLQVSIYDVGTVPWTLLHTEVTTYVENNTAPYTSLVSRKQDIQYEAATGANGFSHSQAFFYDPYGNAYIVTDYGDDAISGDEKTVATTYFPNAGTYVVALPAVVDTYTGTTGTTAGHVAQSVFEYDTSSYTTPPVKGDLTRTWNWWNDATGGYSSTQQTYDAFGNVKSTTDPLHNPSTISYDPTFNIYPVSTTNALNQTASQTWDYTLGEVLTDTDANGATTRFVYDTLGRKTSETDAANATTTWNYGDKLGNVGAYVLQYLPDGSSDDAGLMRATYVDGLGRPYATAKEGVGHINSWQWTTYVGDSSKVSQQSLWYASGASPIFTTNKYDALERTISTTLPDGAASQIAYLLDGAYKPYIRTADPLGHVKMQWADSDGNVTRIREINGGSQYDTTYAYDTLNNRVQTVDAAGNISTATFDAVGRQLSTSDPDLGALSYTYDAAGHLLTSTDAKGQITVVTYDALGRPTSKTADGQTSNWYYDEAGHGYGIGSLTSVLYPGGGKSQSFDIRGQVSISTTCVGTTCKALRTTYDTLGRPDTLTYPDGEAVAYAYDAGGNPANVSGYVTAMNWSPSGQLLSMSYPNGTTNTFTYDPNRLWLNTAQATNSSGTLYTAGYTYDTAARVVSMMQGTPSPLMSYYSYDDLSRLTGVSGAQAQSYAYDAIGNITSNSQVGVYSYDPAHKHAVKTAGANSYAYDANGNMLSGAGRSFTWDAQNRVNSVTSGGATATYVYDDAEERIQKSAAGVATLYFSKLLEQNGSTPIQYYYAGPILVANKRSGVKNWYHADRLGSTRVMTDASGNKVKDYDYKAFGATASSTGSAVNERGYTGHIADAESGLIYMGARYYDATLSRVISADSVIPYENDPQSLNRYTYADNNPISNTDPTGHVFLVDNLIGAAVGLIEGIIAGDNLEELVGDIVVGAASSGLSGVVKGLSKEVIEKIALKVVLKSSHYTWSRYSRFKQGLGAVISKATGKGVKQIAKLLQDLRKTENQPKGGGPRNLALDNVIASDVAAHAHSRAHVDKIHGVDAFWNRSGKSDSQLATTFGVAANYFWEGMQFEQMAMEEAPDYQRHQHYLYWKHLKNLCHRAMTGHRNHSGTGDTYIHCD